MAQQLTDGHGRRFEYLRLSLTDVCNFRCSYCLPDGYRKQAGLPASLTVRETGRLIAAFARMGLWKVRRSELVAINVAHIEGPDSEGAGILHIPSSKTDRKQAGAQAYLSPATMMAITRWCKASEIDQGPLLRRVTHMNDGWVTATAADAHAWVEVYFPGVGWQGFDPTATVPVGAERTDSSTVKSSSPAVAPPGSSSVSPNSAPDGTPSASH